MKQNVIPAQNLGHTVEAKTVSGKSVSLRYAVVELSALVASNHLNGAINQFYPQELQPRDRTSTESVLGVSRNSDNINLSRLSESESTSSGSPIIGEDFVTESGNGRVMAIRKAYAEGKAGDYQARLVNVAGQFGIKFPVESMREPVLVRVRLTELDRAEFAKDCNHDNGAVSQAEQSIIRNMFESVVNSLLENIDRAANSGAVKTLLISASFPTMATDKYDEFEQLAVSVLSRALNSNNRKGYAPAFREINQIAIPLGSGGLFRDTPENKKMRQNIAEKVLGAGFVYDDLSKVARVPEIMDIGSFLAVLNGDNYSAALAVSDRAKRLAADIKDNYIKIELVNLFAEAKYTKAGLVALLKAPINPDSFPDSPIKNVTEPNRALLDYLGEGITSSAMTPEMVESKLVEYLSSYGTGAVSDLDGSAMAISKGLISNSMKLWADRVTEYTVLVGLAPTERERKKAVSALAFVKTQREKNIASEQGSGDVKAIKSELETYINTGKLPSPSVVGAECLRVIEVIDMDRKYKVAIERVSEYLENSIDDSGEVKGKIASIKPSVKRSFEAVGLTIDNFHESLNGFSQLVNGQLPPIHFEVGESDRKMKGRAFANTYNKILSVGDKPSKKVVWHELGHFVEDTNLSIQRAAVALLHKRYATATDKPLIVPLRRFNLEYGTKEYAVNNYVQSPYSTKFYVRRSDRANDIEKARVTELVSTGFEWLSNKKTMHYLMMDKDHFDLVMSAIATLRDK